MLFRSTILKELEARQQRPSAQLKTPERNLQEVAQTSGLTPGNNAIDRRVPMRETGLPLPVDNRSLVSRIMDHFMDKLAARVAMHIQTNPVLIPQPIAVNGPERSATLNPVSEPHIRPASATAPLAIGTGQTETDRQQKAYLEQPTKYSWEQIKVQMDKLGVSEKMMDPMSKALLLNGHSTHNNVQLTIRDSSGLTAPAIGKLVLLEIPGKGPQVAIEPPKLKTSITPPAGLNLYPEDMMRLQKTGMANRPIELKDPKTGEVRQMLVGYNRTEKKLTLVEKEAIRVPSQIKGTTLTPAQKVHLGEGRQITLTGLHGPDGKLFNATMQFSATKQAFQLDRIGRKQTENIATVKQEQKNGPEASAKTLKTTPPENKQDVQQKGGWTQYLKPLSDEENKKWLNSRIEVMDANGKVSNKQVKQLTYDDKVLVSKNGIQKSYDQLTKRPADNALLAPAEQARLLIKLEKSPRPGGMVYAVAKPDEVKAAQLKHTPQVSTRTAVVIKNGASRQTQDQSGSTKASPTNKTVGQSQANVTQKDSDSKAKQSQTGVTQKGDDSVSQRQGNRPRR